MKKIFSIFIAVSLFGHHVKAQFVVETPTLDAMMASLIASQNAANAQSTEKNIWDKLRAAEDKVMKKMQHAEVMVKTGEIISEAKHQSDLLMEGFNLASSAANEAKRTAAVFRGVKNFRPDLNAVNCLLGLNLGGLASLLTGWNNAASACDVVSVVKARANESFMADLGYDVNNNPGKFDVMVADAENLSKTKIQTIRRAKKEADLVQANIELQKIQQRLFEEMTATDVQLKNDKISQIAELEAGLVEDLRMAREDPVFQAYWARKENEHQSLGAAMASYRLLNGGGPAAQLTDAQLKASVSPVFEYIKSENRWIQLADLLVGIITMWGALVITTKFTQGDESAMRQVAMLLIGLVVYGGIRNQLLVVLAGGGWGSFL